VRMSFILLLLLVLCTPALRAQDGLEKGIHDLAVSLSSNMKTSSIKKIAVVEFTDLSGYPSVLGQFISEELITEFFNVSPGQFDVVERRQLAKVLKEQKLSSSGLVDRDTIASVGKLLGIQAIVTGSITDLGSEVKLNARLIAVESAKVFAASSVKVTKDATAERLLHQGAAIDSSSAPSEGGPSRQHQASDVFFQNPLLRVEVNSFALSKNRKSLTLALSFKNITNSELFLAANSNSRANCRATLISNKGFSGQMEVSGLACAYSNSGKDSFSLMSPSNETTVVLTWQTYGAEIEGDVFALSFELLRLEGDTSSQFTVGIANIELRK
jgi:TolB-like protein